MVTQYDTLDNMVSVTTYKMFVELWISTLDSYIPLLNEAYKGFSETFPIMAHDLIVPLGKLVELLPQVYDEALELQNYCSYLNEAVILYKQIMGEQQDELISEIDIEGWYPEATAQIKDYCTDVILETTQIEIILKEGQNATGRF